MKRTSYLTLILAAVLSVGQSPIVFNYVNPADNPANSK